MSENEIKAAALVIRQRCCRSADGRDIPESESIEIARAALDAAERAKIRDSRDCTEHRAILRGNALEAENNALKARLEFMANCISVAATPEETAEKFRSAARAGLGHQQSAGEQK